MARFFHDKRASVILLMVWVVLTAAFFAKLGILQSEFMTFGPSAHTRFMGAVLDTWIKWMFVAIFSFVNTLVHEFTTDALQPWIQNTIQDHKTKWLPYSKTTCHFIMLTYTVYTHVTMVFSIFLYMSQIDFLALRLLADMLVTCYSTHLFTSTKYVDVQAYALEANIPVEALHYNFLTRTLCCLCHDDGAGGVDKVVFAGRRSSLVGRARGREASSVPPPCMTSTMMTMKSWGSDDGGDATNIWRGPYDDSPVGSVSSSSISKGGMPVVGISVGMLRSPEVAVVAAPPLPPRPKTPIIKRPFHFFWTKGSAPPVVALDSDSDEDEQVGDLMEQLKRESLARIQATLTNNQRNSSSNKGRSESL